MEPLCMGINKECLACCAYIFAHSIDSKRTTVAVLAIFIWCPMSFGHYYNNETSVMEPDASPWTPNLQIKDPLQPDDKVLILLVNGPTSNIIKHNSIAWVLINKFKIYQKEKK